MAPSVISDFLIPTDHALGRPASGGKQYGTFLSISWRAMGHHRRIPAAGACRPPNNVPNHFPGFITR